MFAAFRLSRRPRLLQSPSFYAMLSVASHCGAEFHLALQSQGLLRHQRGTKHAREQDRQRHQRRDNVQCILVRTGGLPHAGKRFVVRARVLLGAQSVAPSALGCAAKVGSSPVRTTAVNGPAPYRSCVVGVPVRSKGKSVTVTLLVQYKSSATTRRLTYRIR